VATADDFNSIALWAVPAGVIGGRLYHVITDWERFEGRRWDTLKIWEGGLGIWGGIALGVIVGLWRARVRGLPVGMVLNCAAPALALAQAIGRWGNWFNQELFGRPTNLPWALEVSDATAREAGFAAGTTFHPTFLYESLWCAALCVVLVWIDARRDFRPGRLFFVYAAGYSAVRFFVEGLRIDEADEIAGLRFNQWTSIVVVAVSAGILLVDARRHRDRGVPSGPSGSTVAT
jgi:prolipoprotein diacylglyceryl transferase